MAVHLPTSADYLQQTGVIPANSARTFMVWAEQPTLLTGTDYQTFLASINLTPATYTAWGAIYSGVDVGAEDFLDVDNGTSDVSGTKVAARANTWQHYCWTYDPIFHHHRCYINGVETAFFTLDINAVALTYDLLGGDSSSLGGVTVEQCKQWTRALGGGEIVLEMQSVSAVSATNLWLCTPLQSDLLDTSGNGHDWTQTGSGSFVSGPSIPANSSAATATDLGVLPKTITQNLGDGIFAWFKYTPVNTGYLNVGLLALTNTLADHMELSAWVGSPSALTFWPPGADQIDEVNSAAEMPVTDGTTYYIWVQSNTGRLHGSLVLSALPPPTQVPPAGSIFTNDDTVDFPTVVVSSINGDHNNVLKFVNLPATASETGGDVLADGTFILAADNGDTGPFLIYDAQLTLLATLGLMGDTATSVRTCVTPQVWYAGIPFASTYGTIARITPAGAVTNTYVLPSTSGNLLVAVAASNDEATIYTTSFGLRTVKRWLPASSTFGADLAGAIGSFQTKDILVTGDGTILVLYYLQGGGGGVFVKAYNAAGTVLHTYTIDPLGTGGGAVELCSLFHAIDDPASFWVRSHDNPVAGTCTYTNVRIADGTVLATINYVTFTHGVNQAALSLTPVRFGVSPSCPSFILRAAIAPPTPPTEYLIRRERWFPHLSSEQFRQFFSLLQIDLQAGNGVIAGQGSNPVMEIDWSDDGGWTWSSIHFVETGTIGAYTRRAMLRRMGYARDRVYRIAVTDPAQWVVINGYLQAVLGTS
jgi:hypothetical protein